MAARAKTTNFFIVLHFLELPDADYMPKFKRLFAFPKNNRNPKLKRGILTAFPIFPGLYFYVSKIIFRDMIKTTQQPLSNVQMELLRLYATGISDERLIVFFTSIPLSPP